jgi:hypothetical protein
VSFVCAQCGRFGASVGDIVHKGGCADLWRPKERKTLPLDSSTEEAYDWLIAIDPWQGWAREEASVLAGLIERRERETVAAIVAWLREQSQQSCESKYGRYRRAADAIERGEWRK